MKRNHFEQVFIITYGRSGSTLLQKILNSFDGYLIRGENNNALFHLFKSIKFATEAKNKFSVGKGPIEGLSSDDSSNPWFGIGAIDENKFSNEIVKSFVKNIIKPTNENLVYGFKEIRYFDHPILFEEYLEFMNSVFSAPAFVFNYRNWESVCKSGFWTNKDTTWMHERLKQFEATSNKFLKNHSKNSILLNYEEYTNDIKNLIPLCDFLGVNYNEANILDLVGTKLMH